MRPLHVLQIHTRYREPGGEDAVVDRERALLRQAGHRVTLAQAANPAAAGAAVAALLRAPHNQRAVRGVARTVARARPDVVHVHNTWFALSPAVLAPAAARAPVVMTLHNHRLACVNGLLFRDGRVCTDCVGRAPLPAVVHRSYRGSLPLSAVGAATIALHRVRDTYNRHVARFLAPSTVVRDIAVQSGLAPDRVVVRPHVVADAGPRPAPPSESTTVVFVGRLSPEKGLDTLLAAWARADTAELRLEVIGDGPARPAAGALPAGVTLAGRLPAEQVAARMRAARALVFPSRWYEAFGLVVAEAMGAGLPVVVSDLGGIPELVADPGSWAARAGDPDDWARALAGLRDDGAVAAAGRANRAVYEARYSPAAGLAALEAIYDEVR